MIEIDCRKCANFDLENDRCKVFGPEPVAAVRACADTGFEFYWSEMEENHEEQRKDHSHL